ncbi:coiled-coil and C2 domain-containing protein 1A isoform X2 [Gadus morhua]|uniref:coiled-coil and C2 domain-containing protein 1A isoform X2 n=1 Tax=Gadus morhua TaxID=8049 RepID=UPI0011B54D67|nr:coiled-coil and C2 domain-containing protein 1A isoform X2 [Gadus morhua]XP_030206958.1 coiled-coil and C2 domain-containing protein 1A isoform X2 [Gadus morhua]
MRRNPPPRGQAPPPRGQGAARAKQMGLLLDLTPEGDAEDGGNEEELEAELLALMGGAGKPTAKKNGGRAPVPMEEIERMAALCMKDLDEDDVGEEDLDDEDLLAELNEVLEEVEEEAPRPAPPVTMVTAPQPRPPPGGASGPESVLLERIAMYQAAVANATASGETSKARRYDRGLKTLQSMLASVKKGKPINEEDMPPPVATGGKPNVPPPQPEPIKEREQPAPNLMPSLPTNQKPLREAPPVIPNVKPHSLTPPKAASTALTPGTPAISPLTPGHTHSQHSELKQAVLSRQRDYKMAAIHAKQGGDSELAKQHYLIAKRLDPVLEALDRGEPLDLRSLPPAPARQSPAPSPAGPPPAPAATPTPGPVAPAELAAPGSVEEALTQRMDRYKAAATTAKSTGDERKSRMHQRIVKQYQDSIKAHKAGRPVNLSELPVPPGCPPLQGLDVGQQNFMGVMETAMKLANQEADVEEDSHADAAKPIARPQAPKAPAVPSQAPAKMGAKAQQQLDFLLLRRQGLTNAALRSKQMKDLQGATQHLRHAKGLDAMITAARAGLPVDISQVPDAPVFEEAFSLGRPRTPLSPRSGAQYQQLMELLRKQHQKCRGYCKQFTQIGNLAETLKCERLAEECMKSVEVLKRAHAQGHGAPRARHEERTLNVIRVNPDLSMNDMMLHIIRGINLPTPSGVSSSDLDSSVKFEFPFPSVEEAQCDRTATVRSTSSPEFNESFRLSINRGHRVFRRLSKGIRLEVLHKGGLFKTDKVVGGAQLKMDALENQCEVREILEVLDGRRPTGGKLEVRLQLREPLGGAQLQAVTEKWLVLEPPPPSPTKRPKDRAPPSPRSGPRGAPPPSSSPPKYSLHSFSLLHHEKEGVERKLVEYKRIRREPPADLLLQHRELGLRLQWQKTQLERGSPALLQDYQAVLGRFVQGLGDSVKKFSSQGNREAAKEALGRLKLVEVELESLKRKRHA